jgi:hypothetical protein
MQQFITKYGGLVNGVISGFDRLVFRGSLRTLSYSQGMKLYLSQVGVLLKDFGAHMQALSQRLKRTTEAVEQSRGREVRYLVSPKTDKEAIARQVAAEQGISAGPICVLSTVEGCRSYQIRKDAPTQRLHLEPAVRKCLFYYHYMIHPVFGFMHARIQTWIPFSIQVCINGREWLARQLDAAGVAYVRRDNAFVRLQDPQRAQELLDEQLRAAWPGLLDGIARELNPVHREMFAQFPISYYWCVYQSEWATDVLFRDPQALARLYPRFVHHGLSSFASPDVLRFLGRRGVTQQGRVNGHFQGEVVSSLKHRPEGVRIKHDVNGNSIKLYDKAGSVLRVETTINNSGDLKVYRRPEGQPDAPQAWRRLRKGTADLQRRAELSQAANARYLEALAAVSDDATLEELTKDICRPRTRGKKRFRALRPSDRDDLALLRAVSRGEFLITGFRNRDIARLLFPGARVSATDRRRISTAVSYRLRLLRAHGLIRKLPHTHRYFVTPKGRTTITAVLAAHQALISQLTQPAA